MVVVGDDSCANRGHLGCLLWTALGRYRDRDGNICGCIFDWCLVATQGNEE